MSTTFTNDELARRLEEVERKLDGIIAVLGVQKSDPSVQQPQPGWLHDICGMFADEPAFGEVIEYGRQFRNADRPHEDDEVSR